MKSNPKITATRTKQSSKARSIQKNKRHRLLGVSRMLRYGLDGFRRNAWLSVAATAVMTITLMIIFVSFLTQNVLDDTIGELRNKVKMSIYLNTDTTDEQGADLVSEVEKLSSVKTATFVSASAARQEMAEENSDSVSTLAALKEATNKIPATLSVTVKDINNTTELQSFVKNNSLVKKYINSDYEPSFAGDRKSTIESIGRAVSFAQKIGIAAGAVFVIISALIIFNTIRMAIFNRREEIEMMKLIGANPSFIIGPFIVEAMLYGFIAALVSTGVISLILFNFAVKTLESYQITVQPTMDMMAHFGGLVLVVMMILGAVIGVTSSLLATKRYLEK